MEKNRKKWIILILLIFLLACEKEYELKSLKTSETIEGDFFLGSGDLDGTIRYFAYIKNSEDNSFKPIFVLYDKVRITETNNRPKLIVTESLHGKKYHFYIPENSIKEYFVPDLIKD